MDVIYKKRSLLMSNFYKFRFTFGSDIQDEENKSVLRHKIGSAMEYGIGDEIKKYAIHYVMGVESLNKLGEPAKFHFHIHFTSDAKIGAIRKNLQRYFSSVEEGRKGNDLYSLQQEKDVKDIDRFFRYPLKQISDKITQRQKDRVDWNLDLATDELEYIELQRKLAYEEWNKECQRNRMKMDKVLDKESTFDKLCKYLEDKETQDVECIIKHILEFYKENGLSMNLNTIRGYALTYCVKKDLIPIEALVSKIFPLYS